MGDAHGDLRQGGRSFEDDDLGGAVDLAGRRDEAMCPLGDDGEVGVSARGAPRTASTAMPRSWSALRQPAYASRRC
ncbi:hypothetical protein [Streptomyces sp. NRRL S-646]|uniref:hypothetical protein n=1 Tax=Streptomyces sp. NRRL S-646 TaxID=1463917 RepID=UPI0004C6054D|nr:hypothetical protein [Streptomyces sp. NRRL S-646]